LRRILSTPWLVSKGGLFEVALITYGSTQRSDRSRNRGNVSFKLTEQYEPPFGLPTPVGAYALAAMRNMFEFGTTSEQLAEVAVATRKWATMNKNVPQNVAYWHYEGGSIC
jgi:acetyl-CoA acetyltransferase